jgi:uncharacterized membrane protein
MQDIEWQVIAADATLPTMSQDDLYSRTHGVERTITLTDAVVAIAMTLLVLPLVELAPDVDVDGFGSVLNAHRDVFVGFVLSFLVIYQFWVAHEQAFASVRATGPWLRLLNMIWLLFVAFLPFPTAVVGRAATTTTVPVYIATMFVLSAVTSSMAQLGRRSGPQAERRSSTHRWRTVMTWTMTAVFGLCALLGAVNADLGLFGLLLLVAVRVAEVVGPTLTRRRSDPPPPGQDTTT